MVNRIPEPVECQLQIKVTNALDHEVFNVQKNLRLHPGIHPQERLCVPVEAAGAYRVTARLQSGTAMLAEAEEMIHALEPVQWNSLPVRVAVVGSAGSAVLEQLNDRDNHVSGRPANDPRPFVSLVAQPASLTDKQWESLLQSAEAGETLVIAALQPEDSTAIQALARHGIQVRLHFGIGSWMGCYHWAPTSEVFSGLPSGGVLMAPYAEILPKYVLTELGGETLAGSLRNTQSRLEPPAMLWYSDIEKVPMGKGILLFCQYRAFGAVDQDPAAARLAYNLLKYTAGHSKS